jgi:hypothetical protein
MCVTIFPLMHFSTNLFRTQSLKDLALSVTAIIAIALLTVYLLFGSLIANPQVFGLDIDNNWFAINTISMLTREAILDYDCAGSNVWVYICLHIIPSLIIFFKVLTD